jgi:hypothetical protein
VTEKQDKSVPGGTMKDLGTFRLGLGQQVEREAGVEAAEGEILTEAEMNALLLSIMDGRDEVHEDEIREIIGLFQKAKQGWVTLRATLSGMVAIRLNGGELSFRLGEVGQVVAKENPHLFQ